MIMYQLKKICDNKKIIYCNLFYLLTAGNIAGRNAHRPSTLHFPCTHETMVIYYKNYKLVS